MTIALFSDVHGNYDHGIGLASSDCGCAYKTDVEKGLGAQRIACTNREVGYDERCHLRLLPKHMRLDFQEEPCTLNLLMVLLTASSFLFTLSATPYEAATHDCRALARGARHLRAGHCYRQRHV